MDEINEKLDTIINLLSKSQDEVKKQMLADYRKAINYKQYTIAARIGREYRAEFGEPIVKE